MTKSATIVFILLLTSSLAFADQPPAENSSGKKVGDGISEFFRKLNPAPFLREQEKNYNERKEAAIHKELGH